MRFPKLLACSFALVLLLSIAVPVSAAEDDSAWIELLEITSIEDSGQNYFGFTSTANVTLPLPQQMRIRKVDLLLSVPSGQAPTKISVTAAGSTFALTLYPLGGQLVRAIGYIPNTIYSSLRFTVEKSTSSLQYYQILSCRVSGLGLQEFIADADVYTQYVYFDTTTSINLSGVSEDHWAYYDQVRINVYDWMKYDQLTIWGSVTDASIDSIRATVSTVGLPITVSYLDIEASGSWTEWVADYGGDTGASMETQEFGKYLYNITIDLSGVDKTLTDPLYVYLTLTFDNAYGCLFNCQYVNGSVFIADTTNVSWWQRFTSFMTDLFGGDTSVSDQYQDEAGQQRDELDDMNEQLDNVTKPAVDGIQMDVDNYLDGDDSQALSDALASLTGNSLLISMMCISLTIALVGYVLYGKR